MYDKGGNFPILFFSGPEKLTLMYGKGGFYIIRFP